MPGDTRRSMKSTRREKGKKDFRDDRKGNMKKVLTLRGAAC
jgi:hypothetical protein